MRSLTRTEAAERAALLTVESYTVDLDLTLGDAGFRSTVTIRFRATPGAATFVEIKPARLLAVRLNDVALDAGALAGNRFPLTGLRAENTLTVEAEMAYSNTGEGLHRFVDPADGETYLYAMSFLDEAQRIFAAFDQPDLKAPVSLAVTAPPQWTVAANGAPAGEPRDGRWEFAPTPPLATYFVSLIAGPYHVRRDEHDGVPLALYCRRSLAAHLDADADELFTITRACLDRFHALFGVRYPFGTYDQAFVPEFNAGAMENPGLVTLRDDYVFRSAVTDGQREQRATTIAHEMAHMWFGDLVTMRWWDDLWLNESFAEYMGTRVTAEATRFARAWTTFGMRRKGWGYAADQRPSTHPVAPPEVADAARALLNFDGISYAKGASVLRQLVAWVGDEAFLAGLCAYFRAHAFGNATLADLLSALSESSGRDLSGWADLWLRRAQVNTLRAEVTLDGDGRYAEVAVVQTAPPNHPVLRPHRIGLGLYDRAGADVTLRERIEVDLDPAADNGRTVLARLRGERAAELLLLNDGDLTFAKIRLDPASAAAVPALLPGLADPLARAVLWGEAIDAVRDGERPVADLVALILAALPVETEVVVVEDVLAMSRTLIDRYLEPGARPAAVGHVAQACGRLLAAAPAGGSLQLAAARGLIGASADPALLTDWLANRDVPAGLVVDTDLRWTLVHRLTVLGAAGEREIAAEAASDRSATGQQWAARCRAALPEAAAKERAWQVIVADTTVSNRIVEANAEGFWQPEQLELTAPYVARYFAEMPAAARLRTGWVAERVASLAFPHYAVAATTREAAAALLARDDLEPGLRRAVTDADDDLGRALRARC
ncbi:Membrane alanyl aminopeptidase Metallo peptidase. MEROPS family M01 [Micromonospora pattaloongensis]|uniref:Aminopeptidase N n=1 Tax=Micromonospora pattaloongensis TaxID=405436 RepID=A0A1H3RNJ0_9ACTN|nr:aminopeptidase N [Micromonospora pattaloongensis]SDZ26469.1 Membrane alanyl aminopeptidase Metallo peptidase. MEROPS family M01 [Micromonospora pattaloongensis]